MAIMVKKFGGTSPGTIDLIHNIIEIQNLQDRTKPRKIPELVLFANT